eukprot:jgi/Hompol1/4735/HPOL_003840-RA
MFESIWSPEPLYALLTYPDSVVRVYAARTLSIIIGMSDAQRHQFLALHLQDNLDSVPDTDAVLDHGDADATPERFLSILPLVEQALTEADQAGIFETRISSTTSSFIVTADYADRLVLTETTSASLHRMALSISLGTPILLQGPAGSGKTALVEEASRIIGSPDLLKIHLGDQTDSKILLGTYMTTSTPGSFKWQKGVLTTAVSEGKWILIEDIDLAPVDVIAVLVPLLETRWLHIPSRGERIKAKDGFRMFATRRVNDLHPKSSSRASAASNNQKHLGENLWDVISVQSLDEKSISQVLHTRFPMLRNVVGQIMESYSALKSNFEELHAVGRQLSLRDLIKWCQRVSRLYPTMHKSVGTNVLSAQSSSLTETDDTLREHLFREALDCFIAMLPKPDIRHQLAVRLGETLAIPLHRIEFFLETFVPQIETDHQHRLTCGRAELEIFDAKRAAMRRAPFASTTTSLRVMEMIGVAVSMGEPVLLVGETGTGMFKYS